MRRKSLTGKTDRRDGRLLHIDALAVDVGRGQYQRGAGADRRNHIALGRLVFAKLDQLVTAILRVVGRKVPRCSAVIFMTFRLPVRLDRQVTTAATGGPAEVAGETDHIIVTMRPVSRGNAATKGEFTRLRTAFCHELC